MQIPASDELLRIGYDNDILKPTITFEALAVLDDSGEMTAVDITNAIDRPHSSTHMAIDRLESKGLIEEVRDGVYRRV